MNKDTKFFSSRSKTFAYSIQYITNKNFFKFQNEDKETIYSFEVKKEESEEFYEKIKKLNDIKFS